MFESDEIIRKIVRQDSRYARECYLFVQDALSVAERNRSPRPDEPVAGESRHVTGRDLLEAIRQIARDRFGPLAPVVFRQWGVRATEDFGRVVFNMVDAELMRKQETDTIDDFKDGFDIETAFEEDLDLKIMD